MVELVKYSNYEDYRLERNGEVTLVKDKPPSHLIKDVRKKIREARGKYYVSFIIRKNGEVAYRLPMR